MKTYKRKTGIWHYIGKRGDQFYCCIEKPKSLTFGTCDNLFRAKYVISFKKVPQLYYVGGKSITTPKNRWNYFDMFFNKGNYSSKRKTNQWLSKKGKKSHFTKLFIKMARKNKKGFKNKIDATKLTPKEYLFAVRNKKLFKKIPFKDWKKAVELIIKNPINIEVFKEAIFNDDMKNLLD